MYLYGFMSGFLLMKIKCNSFSLQRINYSRSTIVLSSFVLLGFVLRLGVAIWNGYFGPSFGAELDAATFHLTALEYSENPTFDKFRVGWVYTVFLGLVYYFVGGSLFVGGVLSCVAWLVSALVLVKCFNIFLINKFVQAKAMFVYALLPSSVFFTGVTLREPFQLLFLNIAIYAFLRVYFKKSYWSYLLLIISIVFAGALHGALMAFGVFFLCGVFLLSSLKSNSAYFPIRLFIGALFFSVLVWLFFIAFSKTAYNLEDGLDVAVASFQARALDAEGRANYRTDTDISGFLDLAIFAFISFFQYLFEPLPWKVSTISDVFLMAENFFRFVLMLMATRVFLFPNSHKNNAVVFIAFFCLFLEIIWSVGTINWGTAARHHLPVLGFLLISAFCSSAFDSGGKYKLSRGFIKTRKNNSLKASKNLEAQS